MDEEHKCFCAASMPEQELGASALSLSERSPSGNRKKGTRPSQSCRPGSGRSRTGTAWTPPRHVCQPPNRRRGGGRRDACFPLSPAGSVRVRGQRQRHQHRLGTGRVQDGPLAEGGDAGPNLGTNRMPWNEARFSASTKPECCRCQTVFV